MSSLTLSSSPAAALPSAAQPWRFAAVDFAVLFALLALVNTLVSRGDVGWFALSPTPYIIIPVLLGVRYGFTSGVTAGLVTILLLLIGRHLISHSISLPEHRFTLLSWPFLGALAGQAAEGLRKRRLQAEEDNVRLQEENRHLRAERELMQLSRQDLQQRLGLFGASSASLDEELQELAETSREFAPAQLLSSLERVARVRSAALYLVPERSKAAPLARVAAAGDSSKFPEFLYRQDHQIVEEAIANGTFLIQKSVLETTPARTAGYLGAYPITAGDNTATYVLVVQDVPFCNIGPNTFEVMKSICDWTKYALTAPLHHQARHRAVSQSEFFAALETAVAAHKQQGVPSTVVRIPFDLPADLDPADSFRSLLLALPRTTIVSNANEQGRRSLLFLLPAVSDPETVASTRASFTAFGEQLNPGETFGSHFVTTLSGETPQQLWGRLLADNQDLASR